MSTLFFYPFYKKSLTWREHGRSLYYVYKCRAHCFFCKERTICGWTNATWKHKATVLVQAHPALKTAAASALSRSLPSSSSCVLQSIPSCCSRENFPKWPLSSSFPVTTQNQLRAPSHCLMSQTPNLGLGLNLLSKSSHLVSFSHHVRALTVETVIHSPMPTPGGLAPSVSWPHVSDNINLFPSFSYLPFATQESPPPGCFPQHSRSDYVFSSLLT